MLQYYFDCVLDVGARKERYIHCSPRWKVLTELSNLVSTRWGHLLRKLVLVQVGLCE